MSHQDLKAAVCRLKGQCLKDALHSLLTGVDWKIRFREDCTWTPQLLTSAALLWAWSDESTLVERFHTIRKIILFLFSRQQQLAGSYQAFMKLLVRWTDDLVSALQVSLRKRLLLQFPDCWKIHGYVLFGVDGSRVDLPRTQSHEQAYSSIRKSKNRKSKSRSRKALDTPHSRKRNSPQMWLTTLWHVATGLPWNWRIGPADSSERSHLREMLESLPLQSLIVADAGFVGYDVARAILDGGRQLLIRVGSNVRLLRHLGWARETSRTVYLWPDQAAKKNLPPVVLRLIVVHNGRHPVYLVTSVLSSRDLTDSQLVELYRRRWGIELFYRHLKQTFQRRKLRSASADPARVELEWSVLGLWAMGFHALIEARRVGTIPSRISVVSVLRAFRRTLKEYRHPSARGEKLGRQLQAAVIDSYTRTSKASRNYPVKKHEKPPEPPIINIATPQQINRAKHLTKIIQEGLTA